MARHNVHQKREYEVVTTHGSKRTYKHRVLKKVSLEWVPSHQYKVVKEGWYKDLILDFRYTRYKQKLSQAQLAKLIGSNQAWVSAFENGRVNPSMEFLSRIAKALNKNITFHLG